MAEASMPTEAVGMMKEGGGRDPRPWHEPTFWSVAGAFVTAIILVGVVAPPEHVVPLVGTIVVLALLSMSLIYRLLRQAEHRRREAALFRSGLDTTPDPRILVGPNDRTVHANLAFLSAYGPPGIPTIGILRSTFAAYESADAEIYRLADAADAGNEASAEICRHGENGAYEWREISVRPLANPPGHTVWEIRDITATREAERQLQREQAALYAFFEAASVGLFTTDEAGRFLTVNQPLADLLGLSVAALVDEGKGLGDVAADEQNVDDLIDAGSVGADVQQIEAILKAADGRKIPVTICRSRLLGQDGQARVRSIVVDRLADREIAQALHHSERLFEQFFDEAPLGIALLDLDGMVVKHNLAFQALCGSDSGWAEERPLTELVEEEDRGELTRRISDVIAGRAFTEPLELRLGGGRDAVAALYVSRIEDIDGETTGLILQFLDTTEQKNLEVQFAHSQKMEAVGRLTGGVAHDFNNLLTAMIGFCDLLLLRHRPGDPSFADVMQIKQNANRAANLVRQLLAFSRQQTLQPKVLNITDVLAELSNLLRRLIGENIDLEMVHGRDLGLVKVDQGQLEQVIINLAVNARDALPTGGRLAVRTANVQTDESVHRGHELLPAGDYVLIEVTDTGVGIEKENLGRIFEPFFSTKEVGSGTGLGLSTVYGIVKQTGGFVFVDSAPGEGATFTIFLPRHREEPGVVEIEAPAAKVSEKPRDLTGAGTVLLVEDEEPVRMISARALRNKGYKVLEASSGEAALEVLAEDPDLIDILITDVVMPNMDGPSLIREVRARLPEMRVICISGYAEDAFRKKLDRQQDIHFLPKPYSLNQLAGKVKEVIREAS